jgi:hypothetical protein
MILSVVFNIVVSLLMDQFAPPSKRQPSSQTRDAPPLIQFY